MDEIKKVLEEFKEALAAGKDGDKKLTPEQLYITS
jgi:hypothetical protein